MSFRLPDVSIQKITFHELLRRLVGTVDGKARAGVGQGGNPAPWPDALPSSSPKKKEAVMARLKRALARMEDHWLAELIGAVSIFALLWAGLLFGHAWGM